MPSGLTAGPGKSKNPNPMIYYNELDPKCCALLRYQIEQGNLPPGYVDERSITNVETEELKEYKQIHLFAGIGGFPFGFKLAGLPDNISICTGGFPCQDLSNAGRRKGLAGKRSGLWFEFLRVIGKTRPEWVVIENVAGLLSSNSGRDMAIVLSGLGQCGYWWAYRVLDSQFFGVPQRRRRVFIVASTRKFAPQEILFERDSSPWDTPPGRAAGAQLAFAITERTRDTGRNLEIQEGLAYALTNPGSGGRPHSRLIAYGGNNTSGAVDVACALNAHATKRYDFESETFITNTFNGYTGGVDDNDAQGWHYVPALSETLNSGGNEGGFRTEPGAHIVAPQIGVRRLTPLECERLQGFPDGWTEWGETDFSKALDITEPVKQSDSARYRQLGNAVTVPVIEWIGQRIVEVNRNL